MTIHNVRLAGLLTIGLLLGNHVVGEEGGNATGVFHLDKLNGRDCLITPDGKPFLSLGINHIQALTQKGEPDLFAIKFNRDRTKASQAALADLRAMGFNTAGYGAFHQMREMIPFMADSFLTKNSNFLPDSDFFYSDIFDSKVQEEIRHKLRYMCRVTDKPNLIGYYWTDTPQWDLKRAQWKRGTDWVSAILELPADAPGRKRYEQFVADSEAAGVPADDDGFLRLIAREYYKVIGEETRRLHPNALIFGERYLVNDHPDCVLEEAMPYIDVLSIQPGGARFDGTYLDQLHAKYKKPILLCDHQISFPTDRYPKTMWQQLKSEEAAGLAYAQYLKDAFAKPYIIGYHRCQYIDRFATYQGVLKQGVLRENGTPYETLVKIMRKANLEAIRNFEVACNSWSAESVPLIKPRLIVMADMGNEPDEEQQMAHLLMYANKVDLEGLIACSGKYLHADRADGRTETHPELFHRLVNGYAEVVENLKQHESGWPEVTYLRSMIMSGTAGYGIDAVKPGQSNEASKLIEAAILKDDPRPLFIVCNAGGNTLAQALVDLDEERTRKQMDSLCSRIIVFENGAQDNSGAWIAGRYPKIAWHRSNHQTYSYGGPGNGNGPYTWEPFQRDADGQNEWARKHIMTDHGALGASFPPRIMNERLFFIEGGGTIPWMGLVNHGLTDPQRLYWGGWSGRFSRVRHKNPYSRHSDIRADEERYGEFFMFEADSEKETWTDPVHGDHFEGRSVPVWRFRRAMFNDFQARMDWCVKPFADANHNPVAALDGDAGDNIIRLKCEPGETVSLDASASSDPDQDSLRFHWWIYQEAGTYENALTISQDTHAVTSLQAPEDAAGKEIHVILEVVDKNRIVSLYDYRRIVLSVERKEPDADQ